MRTPSRIYVGGCWRGHRIRWVFTPSKSWSSIFWCLLKAGRPISVLIFRICLLLNTRVSIRPLRCGKIYWRWCFWFLDTLLSSLSSSSSESDGTLALSSSPAGSTLRLDFLRSLRKVRLFLAILAVVSGLTVRRSPCKGVTLFSSDMISVDGVRDLRLVLRAIPSPSLSFADFVAWSCWIFFLLAFLNFLNLLLLFAAGVSLKTACLGGFSFFQLS